MPRLLLRSVRALAAMALIATPRLAIAAPPPPPGAMHALVIGIDTYQHAPPLRGAVADARDVARGLARLGAIDVHVLLNEDATRPSALAALDALVDETRAGDTVFLGIAGYGAREPGRGDVFLLSRFDPTRLDAAADEIRGSEVTRYLHRIEAAGGHAVVVSDTGFGTEIARDVDARVASATSRTLDLPPLRDKLYSVAERTDEHLSPADLHHTLWLSAVDERSRAQETLIAGLGYRGALSYAFARALDGAADADGDGVLTTSELFSYVRQVVHELSDQRQVVVLKADADLRLDIGRDGAARGISVRPVGAPPQKSSGFTIAPVGNGPDAANEYDFGAAGTSTARPDRPPDTPDAIATAAPARSEQSGGMIGPPPGGAPIRLASLDGKTDYFKGLQAQEPVVFVAPSAAPDLVWDPRTHDVLAGADVIARNVDGGDLAGVVERSLVLGLLKLKGTNASQPITLLPNDNLHTKGTRIEIEVGQLTNRYLVLFNLSGNGNVQLLYPLGSDAPQRPDPTYSVEFQVREPFGADHVVAVTSGQRMATLERLLKQSGRRLSPDRLAEELGKGGGQTVRVGFVGLFTTP